MNNFDLKTGNKYSIDEMIAITKENYGEIEISNYDFLKWQYDENPAGEAYIKLAYSGEELAGQYIVIPMKVKVYDNILESTLSLNTLTKEKFRGKGLFTVLAENIYFDCKKNNVQFTYGFPNPNSYPGFIKKLSFYDLGEVPLLIRPLNIVSMLQKKFRNSLFSVSAKSIRRFFEPKVYFEDENIIEITDNNIAMFDEFWKNIQCKYSIIGVRDSRYMKWRYIDIPLREYKIFAYVVKGKIVAYVVTRLTDIESFKSGMILDFLCLKEYEEIGNELIRYILNYFYQNKMDMVGCLMLGQTSEYKILRKNKFFRTPKFLEPQPFPVILRKHIDDNKDYSLTNWFLTMGDYDVI